MTKVSKRLIDVTGMRDVVQRRIPVLKIASNQPGPNVWLAGCIHGDEPGGTAIIHEVFNAVREAGLNHGQLHALPLINSMGFENVSRYINAEREDLNRCFPGDSGGTLGQRIARRLFELIARTGPDLVIDLHNDWIQSVPYALIEPRGYFPSAKLGESTVGLATATRLLVVQESEVSEEIAHTLTGAFVASGTPAFTIEAGGACGIVEENVDSGKIAVLGVLHELGMVKLSGSELRGGRQSRVLEYTSRPLCTSSGIVRFSVSPGDEIAAKQEVARVYSAFGSVEETLRAMRAGYVLGVSDHARAVPGSEVIAIAEFDRSSGGVQ